MSDETVDPKYKLMFNLGYNLTNSSDTRKLLQDMIQKTPHEWEKQAMRAGRARYMEKQLDREGEKMTTPPPPEMEEPWHRQHYRETRSEQILQRYYDEMGPLPTEEKDAKLIAAALEKPKESTFVPSDRVGTGPKMSAKQIEEYENNQVSERAKQIARDAKQAEAEQRMADKRKKRDKDRGR